MRLNVDEMWFLYDNWKDGFLYASEFSPPSVFPEPSLHPRKSSGPFCIWY